MSGCVIRPAAGADAETIAAVARETFAETFGHLYSRENLAAFLAQHTAEAWAREIADPSFAIATVEADDTLAGYIKLGPAALPYTPATGAIELRQFYLRARWHGAGLAPDMMAWVLDTARARDAQWLYLSVYIDNRRAQRFYAHYGLTEVGPYAFMVGDHADEDIVMRLAL